MYILINNLLYSVPSDIIIIYTLYTLNFIFYVFLLFQDILLILCYKIIKHKPFFKMEKSKENSITPFSSGKLKKPFFFHNSILLFVQ